MSISFLEFTLFEICFVNKWFLFMRFQFCLVSSAFFGHFFVKFCVLWFRIVVQESSESFRIVEIIYLCFLVKGNYSRIYTRLFSFYHVRLLSLGHVSNSSKLRKVALAISVAVSHWGLVVESTCIRHFFFSWDPFFSALLKFLRSYYQVLSLLFQAQIAVQWNSLDAQLKLICLPWPERK